MYILMNVLCSNITKIAYIFIYCVKRSLSAEYLYNLYNLLYILYINIRRLMKAIFI